MRAGVDLTDNGPDEADELPGDGCGDLAVVLADGTETAGARAESPKGSLGGACQAMPCTRSGAAAALACRCRVLRAGKRQFHAASTRIRRTWPLPVLVIPPVRRLGPGERSLGTGPRKLINCRGVSKRVMSPSSARMVTALRIWMPRKLIRAVTILSIISPGARDQSRAAAWI